MTDLLRVLPHFPVSQYASLIPGLEKHHLTTTDLLTLEVADIGKRTQLPLLDLKRLCNAVLDALHSDLGVADERGKRGAGHAPATVSNLKPPREKDHVGESESESESEKLRHAAADLKAQWSTISTLDPTLDAALGGGIPTAYITEVTGESGAGKTQFLLSLLLAVQLPPPHGLGRPALYISTEASLSTRRLTQMLNANPLFKTGTRPSLDNIISTTTPDLESQEHILTYQVPVEVARRNVGLIVLDSVAANYRAEFDRSKTAAPGGQGSNMGARGAELVRLGMLLRDLARKHNLAVVVSNQVADRFGGSGSPVLSMRKPPAARDSSNVRNVAGGASTAPRNQQHAIAKAPQESPLASRSRGPHQPLPHAEPSSSMADALPRSSMPERPTQQPPPSEDKAFASSLPSAPPALELDHQQRWFTGWGDDPSTPHSLKTPSLGLVWTAQVACRIALLKAPAYGKSRYSGDEDDESGTPALKSWRRWMKIVFAPHVKGTGPGLEGAAEFEVTMGGLKAVTKEAKAQEG